MNSQVALSGPAWAWAIPMIAAFLAFTGVIATVLLQRGILQSKSGRLIH